MYLILLGLVALVGSFVFAFCMETHRNLKRANKRLDALEKSVGQICGKLAGRNTGNN